jgi:hypothetical protein
MRTINRGVIILRAKPPFLEWLRNLPDPAKTVTLEDLHQDTTAYLIADSEVEDFDRWLRRNYGIMFQEQLWGWWTDETHWPAKRDFRTFKARFDVEVHSMVFDLAITTIIHENL